MENEKYNGKAKIVELELCKESQELLKTFHRQTLLRPFAVSVLESAKLQAIHGVEWNAEGLTSGRYGRMHPYKPMIVSLPIEIFENLSNEINKIQDEGLRVSIASMLSQGIIHQ